VHHTVAASTSGHAYHKPTEPNSKLY
jgi:hypothetical protein